MSILDVGFSPTARNSRESIWVWTVAIVKRMPNILQCTAWGLSNEILFSLLFPMIFLHCMFGIWHVYTAIKAIGNSFSLQPWTVLLDWQCIQDCSGSHIKTTIYELFLVQWALLDCRTQAYWSSSNPFPKKVMQHGCGVCDKEVFGINTRKKRRKRRQILVYVQWSWQLNNKNTFLALQCTM